MAQSYDSNLSFIQELLDETQKYVNEYKKCSPRNVYTRAESKINIDEFEEEAMRMRKACVAVRGAAWDLLRQFKKT